VLLLRCQVSPTVSRTSDVRTVPFCVRSSCACLRSGTNNALFRAVRLVFSIVHSTFSFHCMRFVLFYVVFVNRGSSKCNIVIGTLAVPTSYYSMWHYQLPLRHNVSMTDQGCSRPTILVPIEEGVDLCDFRLVNSRIFVHILHRFWYKYVAFEGRGAAPIIFMNQYWNLV